jgi:hypothetical protein
LNIVEDHFRNRSCGKKVSIFLMDAIRTFLKRTVGQHSSNNSNLNPGTTTDSSSDTSSSSTASEHLNNRTNNGYSSTSTLGILINNNNDDSLRRPLLNIPSTNRRRRFFSCLINNSPIMNTQDEQLIDENTCLLDKKLPKELLLRIFSFLDYQSLCRCAQVSKVNIQNSTFSKNISRILF